MPSTPNPAYLPDPAKWIKTTPSSSIRNKPKQRPLIAQRWGLPTPPPSTSASGSASVSTSEISGRSVLDLSGTTRERRGGVENAIAGPSRDRRSALASEEAALESITRIKGHGSIRGLMTPPDTSSVPRRMVNKKTSGALGTPGERRSVEFGNGSPVPLGRRDDTGQGKMKDRNLGMKHDPASSRTLTDPKQRRLEVYRDPSSSKSTSTSRGSLASRNHADMNEAHLTRHPLPPRLHLVSQVPTLTDSPSRLRPHDRLSSRSPTKRSFGQTGSRDQRQSKPLRRTESSSDMILRQFEKSSEAEDELFPMALLRSPSMAKFENMPSVATSRSKSTSKSKSPVKRKMSSTAHPPSDPSSPVRPPLPTLKLAHPTRDRDDIESAEEGHGPTSDIESGDETETDDTPPRPPVASPLPQRALPDPNINSKPKHKPEPSPSRPESTSSPRSSDMPTTQVPINILQKFASMNGFSTAGCGKSMAYKRTVKNNQRYKEREQREEGVSKGVKRKREEVEAKAKTRRADRIEREEEGLRGMEERKVYAVRQRISGGLDVVFQDDQLVEPDDRTHVQELGGIVPDMKDEDFISIVPRIPLPVSVGVDNDAAVAENDHAALSRDLRKRKLDQTSSRASPGSKRRPLSPLAVPLAPIPISPVNTTRKRSVERSAPKSPSPMPRSRTSRFQAVSHDAHTRTPEPIRTVAFPVSSSPDGPQKASSSRQRPKSTESRQAQISDICLPARAPITIPSSPSVSTTTTSSRSRDGRQSDSSTSALASASASALTGTGAGKRKMVDVDGTLMTWSLGLGACEANETPTRNGQGGQNVDGNGHSDRPGPKPLQASTSDHRAGIDDSGSDMSGKGTREGVTGSAGSKTDEQSTQSLAPTDHSQSYHSIFPDQFRSLDKQSFKSSDPLPKLQPHLPAAANPPKARQAISSNKWDFSHLVGPSGQSPPIAAAASATPGKRKASPLLKPGEKSTSRSIAKPASRTVISKKVKKDDGAKQTKLQAFGITRETERRRSAGAGPVFEKHFEEEDELSDGDVDEEEDGDDKNRNGDRADNRAVAHVGVTTPDDRGGRINLMDREAPYHPDMRPAGIAAMRARRERLALEAKASGLTVGGVKNSEPLLSPTKKRPRYSTADRQTRTPKARGEIEQEQEHQDGQDRSSAEPVLFSPRKSPLPLPKRQIAAGADAELDMRDFESEPGMGPTQSLGFGYETPFRFGQLSHSCAEAQADADAKADDRMTNPFQVSADMCAGADVSEHAHEAVPTGRGYGSGHGHGSGYGYGYGSSSTDDETGASSDPSSDLGERVSKETKEWWDRIGNA